MSWLHRILGSDGTTQLAIDATHKAARVHLRPPEAVGFYRVGAITGTLAAALAGNAVVFSARWGDATKLAAITKLKTRFMPLTPFTAATLTDHTSFDAFVGRAFSAAHTGGAAVTLTGDNQKMRQTHAASAFADMRIATTAALAGGTVTADGQAFARTLRKGNRANPAAATEEVVMPSTNGMDVEFDTAAGEHPIILAANEGIVIRNRTVWPAAGTGILAVEMSWYEISSTAAF